MITIKTSILPRQMVQGVIEALSLQVYADGKRPLTYTFTDR